MVGVTAKNNVNNVSTPNVLSNDEIDSLLESLNTEKTNYYTHALDQEEINQLLTPKFFTIEEFKEFITKRHQPEDIYGHNYFSSDLIRCRFFESKNGESVLSEIEAMNNEQGMGNITIPNTNIKLINYSICPKCDHIFSFKELTEYYANPRPDTLFRNRAEQYREDTRVLCIECNTYFLPALVISDGTPNNEVQFLCKLQTVDAIEQFYFSKRKKVLTAKKTNVLIRKEESGKIIKAILNDVLLTDMIPRPTLIINLLQYSPGNLALNLIEGSNIQKRDILFGEWM